MSATVTIPDPRDPRRVVEVKVPQANAYEVHKDTGHLELRTSAWSERIAFFKSWIHIIIEPTRGSDGRFIKKGTA